MADYEDDTYELDDADTVKSVKPTHTSSKAPSPSDDDYEDEFADGTAGVTAPDASSSQIASSPPPTDDYGDDFEGAEVSTVPSVTSALGPTRTRVTTAASATSTGVTQSKPSPSPNVNRASSGSSHGLDDYEVEEFEIEPATPTTTKPAPVKAVESVKPAPSTATNAVKSNTQSAAPTKTTSVTPAPATTASKTPSKPVRPPSAISRNSAATPSQSRTLEPSYSQEDFDTPSVEQAKAKLAAKQQSGDDAFVDYKASTATVLPPPSTPSVKTSTAATVSTPTTTSVKPTPTVSVTPVTTAAKVPSASSTTTATTKPVAASAATTKPAPAPATKPPATPSPTTSTMTKTTVPSPTATKSASSTPKASVPSTATSTAAATTNTKSSPVSPASTSATKPHPPLVKADTVTLTTDTTGPEGLPTPRTKPKLTKVETVNLTNELASPKALGKPAAKPAAKTVITPPPAVAAPVTAPAAATPVSPAVAPAAATADRDEYGEDDFDQDTTAKPTTAASTDKSKPKSTIAMPPPASPVSSPRSTGASAPSATTKVESGAKKSASNKKDPPSGKKSVATTDSEKPTSNALDYDRQRREIMKSKRLAAEARAKEKSDAAAAKLAEEAKLKKPFPPSPSSSRKDLSTSGSVGGKKPPILPPPSPRQTDSEFIESLMGKKSPRKSSSKSPTRTPREHDTNTASMKSPRQPHSRPGSSPSPTRSKKPVRAASARPSNTIPRPVPPPQPAPWSTHGTPAPTAATQGEEEKQQSRPDLDSSDPRLVYAFNDARAGLASPTHETTAAHARPQTSHSATTSRSSRAMNGLARTKLLSKLGSGRPGVRRWTRPQTAHLSGSGGLFHPSVPVTPVPSTPVDIQLALQREAAALEARRVVAEAADVLRSVASDTAGAKVPFHPPEPPINATIHTNVPRCYPSSSITPRMASARFSRWRVQPQKGNAGVKWGNRSAPIQHDQSQQQAWDVSTELAFGHSIVSGLKSRTAALVHDLESHGSTGGRESGLQKDQAELFQSLRVTQSLERYYNLLGQLDISVKAEREEKNALHHVLFQPVVSGGGERSTARPSSSYSARLPHNRSDRGPGTAGTYDFRASTIDSSGLNGSQPVENPWVHSNTARPIHQVRPSSSHATHRSGGNGPVHAGATRDPPNAPPSFLPSYDSLEDPNVASVLSPGRMKVIRQNRKDELEDHPELSTLLQAREDAFLAHSRQKREAEEMERRRKLRMDRPETEQISQRPKSAGKDHPSAPSATGTSGSKSGNKGGMTSRLHQVSSVYSNPAGSKSARSSRAASAASTRPGPYAQQRFAHTHHSHRDAHHQATQQDYLAGLNVRDEDGGEDDVPNDTANTTAALAPGEPDWHTITSAWPSEPSQLTNDLRLLRVIYGEDGTAELSEDAGGAPFSTPSTSAEDAPPSSLPSSSPLRRCSDFYLAEKCLSALHAQLGLPFETSAGDAASSSLRFTASHPPSMAQVRALKQAVIGIIGVRDALSSVVAAIDDRENEYQHVRSLPSIDADKLSSLSSLDLSLLDALRVFLDLGRITFPGRTEFTSGRFGWNGLDLASRVLQEKAELLKRVPARSTRPQSKYSSYASDRLASSSANSHDRTPKEIAEAAAAIVLESLHSQAQSIKQAQGY